MRRWPFPSILKDPDGAETPIEIGSAPRPYSLLSAPILPRDSASRLRVGMRSDLSLFPSPSRFCKVG